MERRVEKFTPVSSYIYFLNDFLFPFFGKGDVDVTHGGTNLLLQSQPY
jgi:hypothetical protein